MSAVIFEKINPRDKRTEGEEKLLNVLKNCPRFDGWTVFEQPHIDSIKPDFILFISSSVQNLVYVLFEQKLKASSLEGQ